MRARLRRAPGAAREWAWWTVNGQAGLRERWKRRRWYWGRRLEIASETASYWAWRMATAPRRRRGAKPIEWMVGKRRRPLSLRSRAAGIASGAALVLAFSVAAATGLFSTGSGGDRLARTATLGADADGTVASAMTATKQLFRVEERSAKPHRRSRAARRRRRKAAARRAARGRAREGAGRGDVSRS